MRITQEVLEWAKTLSTNQIRLTQEVLEVIRPFETPTPPMGVQYYLTKVIVTLGPYKRLPVRGSVL